MLMFEAGESKFKDNILGSEILSEKKHFLSVMNYVSPPPHRFWRPYSQYLWKCYYLETASL